MEKDHYCIKSKVGTHRQKRENSALSILSLFSESVLRDYIKSRLINKQYYKNVK